MTVTIRSGGHQYSGLSSCNGSCIQIDMADYDHFEISNETALVSAGPNVRLGNFYAALAEKNLNLPGGACSEVALGGHVQTGGFGRTVRSQGLLLDHVVAFDIILSDGQSRHVTKPSAESKGSINDDLFWAVLGGSPGAWGVVTNYEFMADRDSDSSPVMQNCIWLYDADTLKQLMLNIIAIHEMESYLADPNYGVWLSLYKREPGDSNIIFAKCLWHGLDNAPFNSTVCDMLFDSAKALNPYAECETLTYPISTGFTDLWTLYFDREFDHPFLKIAQGTDVNLEPEFVDAFVDKVDEIFSDPTNGIYYVTELVSTHGLDRFDPESATTSISHRGQMMTLVSDLFYAESLNADAKSASIEWLQSGWGEWLGNGLFNNGVDQRMTWSTNFGSVDIETVWPFYYEADKYQRLKRIKRRVDPRNVFQTPFTIPVKGGGGKGKGAKGQTGFMEESTAPAAPVSSLSTGSRLIELRLSAMSVTTGLGSLVAVVLALNICVMCANRAWPRKNAYRKVQFVDDSDAEDKPINA